jgi:hypothetical protein
MSSIYRKRGRAAICSNGQTVLVSEAGEAFERDGLFSVRPLRENVDLPALGSAEVEKVAKQIEEMVPRKLKIERLIVTHGLASHELAGLEWSDDSRRIHLALSSPSGVRVVVDRGDFDCAEIERIAAALARVGGHREEPPRIRLAPNVTAALLPMLVGLAPPNVELRQRGEGVDGHGRAIVEGRLQGAPWPNWYRPSYRVKPDNVPMNLELRCAVRQIDQNLPRAIALLAPVTDLTMRVLIEDGSRVSTATIRVSRISAVGLAGQWYPYGAGAFGAEAML